MKKRIAVLLLALFCLGLGGVVAWAQSNVNLEIDGLPITADAPPYITETGYTMVPMRLISEYARAQVEWLETERKVVVTYGAMRVVLVIGSKVAYINDQPVALEAPAEIANSRTMVPVRFIMESLGADVVWEEASRTVKITLATEVVEQPLAEPEVQPQGAGLVTGYYFDSASWPMLQSFAADFDCVSNFAFKIFADGSIAPKTYASGWDAQAEPLLTEQGIERLALITDFGNPEVAGKEESAVVMITDPATRTVAIANIVALLAEKNYQGVDIDFEHLTVASRDHFTAFIRELKAALGDKILAISLPPRRSANETWLDKFDYTALAAAADRLHFMFYDQHYSGSAPGPVASIEWVRRGLDYMLTLVPKEKLHMMLGGYGYSWSDGANGVSIHIPRALEIAAERGLPILRDEASGVPYLQFEVDGVAKEVWFEDAYSLGQKAALARSYGIAGIGLWRMGIVPDDVWQSIIANYSGQ